MAEQESAPSGIDTRIPNMARMYDYALGGKDNFAADRAAVEKLFSFSPENKYVPRANRRFLSRAVRFAAAQGISQFLDLGTGLPSQGHVHESAPVEHRITFVGTQQKRTSLVIAIDRYFLKRKFARS